MNEHTPLITVAMPIYNAGKDLRPAVLSIINQSFKDWELILIDDGSTDNSVSLIADLKDSRIKILHDGNNRGLAARLNEAIDLAKGRYFARMDQDDISYPNRFLRQFETLENDKDLDLVATRAIIIDENNRATSLFPYALTHGEICSRPWQGFYFPHPTWMGKTSWFRKHRYKIPGPYFCEDQELLLRTYKESKFATLDEILFAYRVKGRVNRDKLRKTRQTILKVQLCSFLQTRNWRFALLAILSFFGRRIYDSFINRGRRLMPEKSKTIEKSVLERWHQVLNNLEMRTGTGK
jgi:glycosyltransferase involved in cell wall biosynthesis